MKTHLYLVLVVAAAAACQSRAGSSPTVEWGPVTNGVQLSIALRQREEQKESGKPGDLVVCTRNVSEHTVHVVRYGDPLEEFSFRIRFPSGRNVSLEQRPYPPGSARFTIEVKPNDAFSHPAIGLQSVCDLSEAGRYSIVLKEKVLAPGGPTEVTSNPLSSTVKAATSRKPPSSTNQTSIPGF